MAVTGKALIPKKVAVKTPAKVLDATASDIKIDAKTMALLESKYGSMAAWAKDPNLGPLLLQIVAKGITDATQQTNYLNTHLVDPTTKKITTVTPDKSWFGTHGSATVAALSQKNSLPGVYTTNVNTILNNTVIPEATRLGSKLDPAALQKIAEDIYTNGWSDKPNMISNAILAQTNFGAINPDTATGAISDTLKQFKQIAQDYAIPLPKDPAQLDAFIKSAVGPNGTVDDFTNYAKQVALAQFPWMKASIDQGVKPSAYLTPFATNIANTLDMPASSINWQDPKFSSLLTKADGTQATFSDAIAKVKNDPQYRYDYTQGAKNDAYNLATQIKQMFGYEA